MTSNFFFLKVKKIFRKYTVQLYFNIIIIWNDIGARHRA
jgi:hypothetical protein